MKSALALLAAAVLVVAAMVADRATALECDDRGLIANPATTEQIDANVDLMTRRILAERSGSPWTEEGKLARVKGCPVPA